MFERRECNRLVDCIANDCKLHTDHGHFNTLEHPLDVCVSILNYEKTLVRSNVVIRHVTAPTNAAMGCNKPNAQATMYSNFTN